MMRLYCLFLQQQPAGMCFSQFSEPASWRKSTDKLSFRMQLTTLSIFGITFRQAFECHSFSFYWKIFVSFSFILSSSTSPKIWVSNDKQTNQSNSLQREMLTSLGFVLATLSSDISQQWSHRRSNSSLLTSFPLSTPASGLYAGEYLSFCIMESILPRFQAKSLSLNSGWCFNSSMKILSSCSLSSLPSWYSKGELLMPVKLSVATLIETYIYSYSLDMYQTRLTNITGQSLCRRRSSHTPRV